MAVPYMAVHRGHTIPSRADYAPRPSIRPDRIQTETVPARLLTRRGSALALKSALWPTV
jgi:hypothetical protein